MKYLVIDISNLAYRAFFKSECTDVNLAHHTTLVTLNKYFQQFKPDKMVLCFDRPNWRKQYTASDKAITPKQYKGNRRLKMTPADKRAYENFLQHLEEFEEIMNNHTNIITLAGEGLEGDDLMAGVCQVVTLNENDQVILVSADKDLIQLLQFPNVRLINPADGKDRSLDQWNNDAQLFLFEKCIRGDRGDNVQSAFPRCRLTRIMDAYQDDYKRTNLMNETWTDVDNTTYVVGDLFKENELLMDLTKQPDDIQQSMIRIVVSGLKTTKNNFSFFHFMKFLGKNELKNISDNIQNYIGMLSK